ncbi:MAG: hypothetical protein ABI600_04615 [Luteolibacter sp.]
MFPNDPTDPEDRVNLTGIGRMFSELSVEDRFHKGLEILPEILGCWEKDHPEWRIEVLLWILDGALHTLRHYIESPEETGISWESPYVELHFPVECTWTEGDAESPSFSLNAGRLNKADMTDGETAKQALAKVMVSYLEIMALQDFTNGRALEKHGDGFRRIVDAASIEDLEKIESPEEQERALQQLFHPLSFGAGHIEYGEMKEGDFVGGDVEAQLAAILPPLIQVPYDADGRKMQVITILEINPLVADPITQTAYFPIVVGLAVQFVEYPSSDEDALEVMDSVALPEWPESDRNGLWAILDRVLHNTLAQLNPEPEVEMVEAVLSVNAQIKFMVPKNDQTRFDQAMSHTLDHFKSTGEVLRMDFKRDDCLQLTAADIKHLRDLLGAVENAATARDKGESLEHLVAALFGSIPGFEVKERVRTESEEIDLWISNTSEVRPFSDESGIILAECKNWSGKCGKNEFVILQQKVANRSGRCEIGFLISWNGFAETITTEMLRGSRERTLVVPIDGNSIRNAVKSGNFLRTITEALQRALMI